MKDVYQILKSFNVCYDPKEIGLDETCEGTPLELVKKYRGKTKNTEDIIWAVCRPQLKDDETLRLFSCWCTKELFKLIDNVLPESKEAVKVTELYMYKLATLQELIKVQENAEQAAYNTNTQLEFVVAWASARCAGRVPWVTAQEVSAAAFAAVLRTNPPMDKDVEANKQIDKLIQLLERKEKRNV
jgi:hypothetical protein